MTTPKLLRPDDLSDHCETLANEWPGTTAAIRAHIAALEADNAALLADLRSMHEVAQSVMRHEERERVRYEILDRMEKTHPGATLLEAHAKALSDVEHLQRQRTHVAALLGVADAGAYQNDWEGPVRKALVRARNEGLEKAAEWVDTNSDNGAANAFVLRTMKEPES